MKRFALAFFAAASLVFCGCITDPTGIRIENERLIVDNHRFASHFTMTHQIRRNTTTGFIQVQAWLQNADKNDIQFQYRFQWLDSDGMLLEETLPVWRTARVHGRDRIPLEGVSESNLAADFRLVVRPL